LAVCLPPTQLLSHSPSSAGQGEKKRYKKLKGVDEDREIAHQLPSQAKQA